MTDKEMAKAYEEKAEYVEIDDYGKKVYSSIDIEEAYLAGLKVGRPQWHDLRKDPTDLPPMNDLSDILSKDVFLDTGIIGYYNYNQKKWCVSMGYRLDKPVLAWCEIPKFEVE